MEIAAHIDFFRVPSAFLCHATYLAKGFDYTGECRCESGGEPAVSQLGHASERRPSFTTDPYWDSSVCRSQEEGYVAELHMGAIEADALAAPKHSHGHDHFVGDSPTVFP